MLREVIARGSFSAAAESLHLSQSAVSQQIAVLEREVGIPLLERTSDGPKLTAAGEALMDHGDAVICRLEEAERELAQIAGLEGGRLRLASFPTASATLMTRALSLFRQRFPRVELEFTEDEPEESFPALKRGDVDLAVVFDYPAFPLDFTRDVEAELIYEEPMRVALPPGHPLAAAKSVRIDRSRRRGLALRRAGRAPVATRCSGSAARPASSRGSPSRATTTRCSRGSSRAGSG